MVSKGKKRESKEIKKKEVKKQKEELKLQETLEIGSRYHSRFFGSLIFEGRKLGAFKNTLKVKEVLKLKEKADTFMVFLASVCKLTPSLFLVPLKKGASKAAVPFPLTGQRQISFSIK